MSVKTYPSVCKKDTDGKHQWENVIDNSKPAVQVMPMIWGTYRKIICIKCGKKRGFRVENGENILEE